MTATKSLEAALAERDISEFVKEETLLVHPGAMGNNIEARAIVRLVVDGVEYAVDQVVNLRARPRP